jgi:hypothetical protein
VAPSTAAAALLAPAGYLLSYHRRYRSNLVIKAGLVIGLLVAMDLVRRTVRTAQTGRRRAHAPGGAVPVGAGVARVRRAASARTSPFSMVSSTTLVAAAAVLSLTTGFIGILLAWAALSAAWLWLSAQPRRTR